MSGLLVVILIVLLAALAVGVWQIMLLKQIKNQPIKNNELNDKKYWELKYNIQFITTFVPVIIGALSIVGYKIVDDLPAKIREDISAEISPDINRLRDSLQQIQRAHQMIKSDFEKLNRLYSDLDVTAQDVGSNLSVSARTLLALQKGIQEIKDKDIVKQGIHIITNIKYKSGEHFANYSYNDLVSISGNRLPSFQRPPLVIAYSSDGDQIMVCDITTTYFAAFPYGGASSESCGKGEAGKEFSVLIFEK